MVSQAAHILHLPDASVAAHLHEVRHRREPLVQLGLVRDAIKMGERHDGHLRAAFTKVLQAEVEVVHAFPLGQLVGGEQAAVREGDDEGDVALVLRQPFVEMLGQQGVPLERRDAALDEAALGVLGLGTAPAPVHGGERVRREGVRGVVDEDLAGMAAQGVVHQQLDEVALMSVGHVDKGEPGSVRFGLLGHGSRWSMRACKG